MTYLLFMNMSTLVKAILLALALVFINSVIQIQGKRSRKLEDMSCTPADFHYDFTECDASEGRWRVAIPSAGCEGVVPPIPSMRLDECYKSCEAGEFLNLTTMECESCHPGTYSLGGGLRFDVWDPLPTGFKTQVEKFHSIFTTVGRQNSKVNCTKWGWRSWGDVLVSQGGPCVATLTYNAQLVKPGRLKFTYQNSDDNVLFQFQASGDKCDGSVGSRWPALTGEGVWRTEEIPLRSGLNIFQWKTMGSDVDSHRQKPVLIKRIEVEGVGYTSECNECSPGTFSNQSTANMCQLCPADTFSSHKAVDCNSCSKGYYSEPGSSTCKQRPSCSPADLTELHKPCDQSNQTRIEYAWVERKICIGKLPPPKIQNYCSPCNPGTEYRNGLCNPCPHNYYSNGANDGCKKCPDLTVADTGHTLTQWYTKPPNVSFACISPEDNGCTQYPAWELNSDFVQSGKGHADWVYLVLTLTVGGFRGLGGIINGELVEIGRLTFTFEMKCAHPDCELLLMKGTSSTNATVIQKWVGSTKLIQTEQIQVYNNASYTFSWAFQKLGWSTSADDGDSWGESSHQRESIPSEESYVRIYSINVTNTVDGGASSCVPCQEGFIYTKNGTVNNTGACVACDPGFYRSKIDEISPKVTVSSNSPNLKTECKPCPPATITSPSSSSSNSTTCQLCGPGLITKDGRTCITDCLVNIGGHTYDLRPLKGQHGFRGRSLFTASGNEYFHSYNFSFCSQERAQCHKNVSLPRGYSNQTPQVEALICQSTIFPPTVGLSFDQANSKVPWAGAKPLSTHAGSLGDHLIGISNSLALLGESVARNIQSRDVEDPNQLHFFYSMPDPTPACFKGRSTTLTLQCRLPTSPWSGSLNTKTVAEGFDIRMPEKCPDATCDGCNYQFILDTPYACHLCSGNELKVVRGECKDGFQEVHYLISPNAQCLLTYNSSWPTTLRCRNSLPFAVEVSVQLTIGLTMVLSILLLCFWRRHRKLEYKYMKLVASGINNSGGKNCDGSNDRERDMLPVAESCALDPDEAEEDEDDHFFQTDHNRHSGQIKEVSFYSERALKNMVSRFSVFNRLKSSRKGSENDGSSEIMSLTDKEALT